MNGSGLIVSAILVAVLIAVATGASQIQGDLIIKIEAITTQRDVVLQEALEAKGQRDVAITERENLKVKLAEAEGRVTALEAEKSELTQELNRAQQAINSQNQEITRLQTESVALKNMVDQAKAAPQNPSMDEQNSPSQSSTNSEMVTALLSESNPLGIGLAVLIGMMALGSGGYIVYHHDSNRKYTVKMTREQIRDFARYQRVQGNRAVS
jgi:uncharacterized protein (DUF3084 family)